MRPAIGKTQVDISREWDRIALKRAEQIASGKDLSFSFVLLPAILSFTADSHPAFVLDVGCGPGFLTAEIAPRAKRVVGVDISLANINYAKQRWGGLTNVEFVNASVEDYSLRNNRPDFTLVVANMTLVTVLDLDNVLKSVSRLLQSGGHFVATITHPCFWPIYWGYAAKEWFHYSQEIPIEGTFRISLDDGEGFVTTHVHRPLERYITALARAGFRIDEIREPFPSAEAEAKYPHPWEYPRFLSIRCLRK